MQGSRLERLSPLTGVIAAALFVAGGLVVGYSDYLPSAEASAAFLSANPTRTLVGAYLGGLASFFMIWFAGSLRGALHDKEGGNGRLAAITFAGGAASGALLVISFAVMVTAASRAGAPGGISREGAVTLLDLWGALLGNGLPITLAVMVEATAVASMRHGAFPAWFGWLSSLLALALVTPVGYLALLVALVWLAVVGIWLAVR